jgi:hypothetical protein
VLVLLFSVVLALLSGGGGGVLAWIWRLGVVWVVVGSVSGGTTVVVDGMVLVLSFFLFFCCFCLFLFCFGWCKVVAVCPLLFL